MSESKHLRYYVLRTVTGKEQQVKEYIEAEINHSDLGQYVKNILIPLERTSQVRAGKRISVQRPYYPGYVFVEALLVGEVQHILRSTPNVLGFLGSKTDPTPLRPDEAKRMLGIMDELTEKEEELDLEFSIGEKVKVASGPFAGFYGEVTEVHNEKKKLKLLVKVFGRDTLMDVDFIQVEKEL